MRNIIVTLSQSCVKTVIEKNEGLFRDPLFFVLTCEIIHRIDQFSVDPDSEVQVRAG